jgi:hypothetical protein
MLLLREGVDAAVETAEVHAAAFDRMTGAESLIRTLPSSPGSSSRATGVVSASWLMLPDHAPPARTPGRCPRPAP